MKADTRSATVLLVEDEQPLADVYAQFLESTYTVRTAYDGEEGLESMSSEIDVVLLDRRMPGLSGEEVLRAIREQGYDCRVAMVTAVTPDVDILKMGFDVYLTKPVDRTTLLEAVHDLLESDVHSDLMQEYYRLASKRAALEVKGDSSDHTDHEEFDRLTDRLEDIEDELQE